MISRRLFLLLSLCLLTVSFARAATPVFDDWAERFTAEWVRLNPQLATRTQYFSGAEQVAIDRELVLGQAYGSMARRPRRKLPRSRNGDSRNSGATHRMA